jgi:hypothetical protein
MALIKINNQSLTNVTALPTGVAGISFARLTYELASGSSGGDATSGSYLTYPINTENSDPDNIVTLSSNQFTLGAGDYVIRYNVGFYKCGTASLLLRDITNSANVSHSIGCYVTTSTSSTVTVTGSHFANISSSTVYELQYQVGNGKTGNGLGLPQSITGENERWGEVVIEKML